MRGRPHLYTSYSSDQALMPTVTKKMVLGVFLVLAVLAPIASSIPFYPDFLGDNDWMRILSHVAIFRIGALGINLLTGVAGQVSLGHAFFMGLGAYVAVLFGAPPGDLWGWGLPIWIWLPMAGIIPALIGLLLGAAAVRVRGHYLAFATLGLVFIGEWAWRNLKFITGGAFSGRRFPELQWRLWKEEEPLVDFASDGVWLGFEVSEEAKVYLLMFGLLVVATLVAKNLQRTRAGRAVMENILSGRHIRMSHGWLAGALWWGRARREELDNRFKVEDIVDFLEIERWRKYPVGLLPFGVPEES